MKLSINCGYCGRITCAGCTYLQDSRPDLIRHTYHRSTDDVAADIPGNIRSVMKPQCEPSYFNRSEEGHGSYSYPKLCWSQYLPSSPNVASYIKPAYILSEDDRSRSFHKFSNASANSSSHGLRQSGFKELINNSSGIYYEKPSRPNTINSSSHNYVCQNSQTRQLVEQSERVIFKIQSDDLQGKKITERVLVSVECNMDHISNYESWKPLSEFLTSVTNHMSSTFSAIHIGRKITVSGYGSHLYIKSITKIVDQFAYRSSSERSDMYMNFYLNIQRLYQHLNDKLSEMIEISGNALKLYEDWKKLKLEFIEFYRQDSEDLRNSLRHNKMRLCLKKLLMILYRENFADESLKKLKEVSLKLSYQLQQGLSETTLPVFLKYVYHFNCVFASHEPKALSDWIRGYEYHIYQSNRPRQTSKEFSNSAASQQSGLTSHPTVDSENNQSPLFVLERPHEEYNQCYLHSMVAKKISKRNAARSRFKALIDHAFTCLWRAHQLNFPISSKIQKLIDDFEDKLKNKTCFLKEGDVNAFERYIEKQAKSQRRIAEKET